MSRTRNHRRIGRKMRPPCTCHICFPPDKREKARGTEALAAVRAQMSAGPAMRPDTLWMEGVRFDLNEAGDGYTYDDPRGAEVAAKLAKLAKERP